MQLSFMSTDRMSPIHRFPLSEGVRCTVCTSERLRAVLASSAHHSVIIKVTLCEDKVLCRQNRGLFQVALLTHLLMRKRILENAC